MMFPCAIEPVLFFDGFDLSSQLSYVRLVHDEGKVACEDFSCVRVKPTPKAWSIILPLRSGVNGYTAYDSNCIVDDAEPKFCDSR